MVRFIWTDECEHAFQRLKQLLCSAPILAYPDFGNKFVLQTDVSDYGVGVVLPQLDDEITDHKALRWVHTMEANGCLARNIVQSYLGKSSNSYPQHVILIPSALQADVLKSLHDGPLGGHLGITRTEERVWARFHWPSIRKTVTRHIQLCKICNETNSPTNRHAAP